MNPGVTQQPNKPGSFYLKAVEQTADNQAAISGFSVRSAQFEVQIPGSQGQCFQKKKADYDVSTFLNPKLQYMVLPGSWSSTDSTTMLPQYLGAAERNCLAYAEQTYLTGFDLVHYLLRKTLTPWTKLKQSGQTLPFESVLFGSPIPDISSVKIPTEEDETILKEYLQMYENTGSYYQFTGRIDSYSLKNETGVIRFYCNDRTKCEYFACFKYDDVENTYLHREQNLRIRSDKIVPKLVAHFFLRYNVLEPFHRQLEAFQIMVPYLPYNYPPPSAVKKHRFRRP